MGDLLDALFLGYAKTLPLYFANRENKRCPNPERFQKVSCPKRLGLQRYGSADFGVVEFARPFINNHMPHRNIRSATTVWVFYALDDIPSDITP